VSVQWSTISGQCLVVNVQWPTMVSGHLSTISGSDISVTVTNTKTEMIGYRFMKQKQK